MQGHGDDGGHEPDGKTMTQHTSNSHSLSGPVHGRISHAARGANVFVCTDTGLVDKRRLNAAIHRVRPDSVTVQLAPLLET